MIGAGITTEESLAFLKGYCPGIAAGLIRWIEANPDVTLQVRAAPDPGGIVELFLHRGDRKEWLYFQHWPGDGMQHDEGVSAVLGRIAADLRR